MGDLAFVVSVKNETVITAMDKEQMKEQVITNIDSTLLSLAAQICLICSQKTHVELL